MQGLEHPWDHHGHDHHEHGEHHVDDHDTDSHSGIYVYSKPAIGERPTLS